MSKSASNARRLRRASERVRLALCRCMALPGGRPPEAGARDAWLDWAGRAAQLLRSVEGLRELTEEEQSVSDALKDLDAHVGPLDAAGFLIAWEEAVAAFVMGR